MSRELSSAALMEKLAILMEPKKYGLTQGALDQVLIDFCAGCPDPVKARWLIVECLDPMTDAELVERVLSMPVHRIADVPTSVIPAGHLSRLLGDESL
jgi:hypothetical protein